MDYLDHEGFPKPYIPLPLSDYELKHPELEYLPYLRQQRRRPFPWYLIFVALACTTVMGPIGLVVLALYVLNRETS